MTRVTALFLTTLTLCAFPRTAAAQTDGTFELGAQITGVSSGEFDGTDIGIGGRVGWSPFGRLIGIEGEITGYPGEYPDGDRPFSRSRVEGLFGVTVGPQLGRIRPFARFRPGFVAFRESPEPYPCILIFPPPLACSLAGGKTLFALDIGAGVEVATTPATFLRLDVGDRAVKYPGPVFDEDRDRRDDDFFGHDFRFAIGGGVRF